MFKYYLSFFIYMTAIKDLGLTERVEGEVRKLQGNVTHQKLDYCHEEIYHVQVVTPGRDVQEDVRVAYTERYRGDGKNGF
jgi:hypothetical protein